MIPTKVLWKSAFHNSENHMPTHGGGQFQLLMWFLVRQLQLTSYNFHITIQMSLCVSLCVF
jgi:hypothetical protein